MNVIAINFSPRGGGRSKTELMLNHLVEGMRAAGAAVDTVNLREKKIKNCIGCFTCWTKTPGRCIQKDDMTTEIYPKWLAADMAVYATPDLTIETPFDVWMDIMTRKADGQQMFLDQKYRVTGDLTLMSALFKRDGGHGD